jgi:ArsR family transcriptional regulator
MTENAERAQRYLACVSDPSRFRLLIALTAGERCVTELAQDVGLSQSCTTRHLQALLREGVVRSGRHGKQVRFTLSDEHQVLQPVLRWAIGVNHAPDPGESTSSRPNPGEGRPARRRRAETGPRRVTRVSTPAKDESVHREFPPHYEAGWGTSDAAPGDLAPDAGDSVPNGESMETVSPLAPAAFRRELDDFLL